MCVCVYVCMHLCVCLCIYIPETQIILSATHSVNKKKITCSILSTFPQEKKPTALSRHSYFSSTLVGTGDAKAGNLCSVSRITHLSRAFLIKCLKQLNEKCHHDFDKPPKKFNRLSSRINTSQGLQDPKFSRECSKLTGSPLHA